ncbi:hypothetical protein ACFTS5_24865 [Nocardia sp. NPDC056952]|uniref:hypothetical protein n=1 Tax=Nocardia sp. NPDC056952 TaxID=3345979 RepID=UPI00363E6605
MATQQSTVRATLPAPSTAVVTPPDASVTTSTSPTVPVVVLRADVPIIEPYIVAGYLGNGAVAARVDAVLAQVSARTAASGQAAAATSPRAGASSTTSALGRLVAKVAVKSGKVLLDASLAAVGDSTAQLNTHLPRAFVAEGIASAELVVISSAEALFGGDGRFSGLKPLDLTFTGESGLAVAAAAAGPVVVAAGGSGAGSLSARTGQSVTLSGGGMLAVVQGAPVGTTGSGGLVAGSSAKAGVDMVHTGAGQLSLVAVPSFAPSGMTKSTAWAGMTTAWTNVIGWAADTTSYPGSVVQSDGVVAQSTKAAATLSASIVLTAPGAMSANVTLQLTVNNVVVATGTATTVPSSGSATVNVSAVRAIAAGDVVRVQASGSQFAPQFNPAAHANPASYVRIT